MLHGQIWIILSNSLIDNNATFERDGYSWFTNIDNGSWMLHVLYTTFANFWKSNLDQLRLHLKDCTTFIVQLLRTIDLWNFAFILLADDRDRVSMWGYTDVLMRRELQLWYLFACPNQRVDVKLLVHGDKRLFFTTTHRVAMTRNKSVMLNY